MNDTIGIQVLNDTPCGKDWEGGREGGYKNKIKTRKCVLRSFSVSPFLDGIGCRNPAGANGRDTDYTLELAITVKSDNSSSVSGICRSNEARNLPKRK